MRVQRKWTQDDLDKIETMLETKSRREIASEFGVTVKTIGCVMWRNGMAGGTWWISVRGANVAEYSAARTRGGANGKR